MGLLTNPQTREKISRIVSKYHNKLCFVCYVAGLVWFLALAYKPFNAGTYFSENALLPALVEADFYNDHGAADRFRGLKDEIKAKDKNERYKIPAAYLEQNFQDLGLDTFVQNFSFMYPHGLLKGQKFPGQNVYGILRASRAASTEAVVMSVPYRPPESGYDRTNAGIGLMLGLAKAFRRHTYWAKDIIFLVTEHEQIGMQAWLSAYHYSSNDYILPGELHVRSGSIQAAINLELATDTISRLNIKLEGLNGQLPNLDLVNTVVRLCRREGLPPALHKRTDFWNPESYEGFEHMLKTMVYMMWHQATGVPTGNHGLFHRYHIEAVTLHGVKMKSTKKNIGYAEIGRVLEGVFRSLNNLLERFHQSFFFYLLPSTDRYVSIGLYMPPFGLLAAPVLIKALALWIKYGIRVAKEEEDNEEKEKKKDVEQEQEREHKGEAEKQDEGKTLVNDQKIQQVDSVGTVLSLMPVCVMSAFFGLGAYYGPHYFIDACNVLHTRPQEGVALGLLALQLTILVFPWIIRRKTSDQVIAPDWQLLKCLSLLMLGVVLCATSVMNISLAFFLAAIWTPVVVFIRPSSSRLRRVLSYLLLLLVSPLGLLFTACVMHQLLVERVSSLADLPFRAWDSAQSGLLLAVVDGHMFGNWIYGMVSLTLLPNWCMFWALMWTKHYE